MNGETPVTRSELRAELESLETRLEERLTDKLTGTMRQIETNMLTAFHGYARGEQSQMRAGEVVQEDLRTRMAAFEGRMLNLETHRSASH